MSTHTFKFITGPLKFKCSVCLQQKNFLQCKTQKRKKFKSPWFFPVFTLICGFLWKVENEFSHGLEAPLISQNYKVLTFVMFSFSQNFVDILLFEKYGDLLTTESSFPVWRFQKKWKSCKIFFLKSRGTKVFISNFLDVLNTYFGSVFEDARLEGISVGPK